MALCREQIEHFEYWWKKSGSIDNPWRHLSKSRRWLKKQLHKYMRLQNKKIDDDDIGGKRGRRPFSGWEY